MFVTTLKMKNDRSRAQSFPKRNLHLDNVEEWEEKRARWSRPQRAVKCPLKKFQSRLFHDVPSEKKTIISRFMFSSTPQHTTFNWVFCWFILQVKHSASIKYWYELVSVAYFHEDDERWINIIGHNESAPFQLIQDILCVCVFNARARSATKQNDYKHGTP